MDRQPEVEKVNRVENKESQESRASLLDEAFEQKQGKFDFGKEAQKISGLIHQNDASGAALSLSKDLIPLKAADQNNLLDKLYFQNLKDGGLDDPKGAILDMPLTNDGSWPEVSIRTNMNDGEDRVNHNFRIVRPGDTLSKFAVDDGVAAVDMSNWIKYIAEMNKIKDPNHILPGQAVRVGHWYD
jgi:nucleoid-associated protein YgaU